MAGERSNFCGKVNPDVLEGLGTCQKMAIVFDIKVKDKG